MLPSFATIMSAIIQGVTEFLPVSSSTHLSLIARVNDWPDPSLDVKIGLHIGTLVAVLSYYWGDVWRMTQATLAWPITRRVTQDALQAWFLILATIPVVVVGYIVHQVWPHPAYTPGVMGSASIVGGMLLLLADRRPSTLGIQQWAHAMIIGVGQVLAILWPGSSRSGSCLMLARFLGIERLTALRFTFLLSIPSVLGAAVLMLKDLTISTVDWGQLLWGIMIAAAVGTCTIHSLERLWSYQALLIISIYRILLGIGILVFMR